MAFLSFMSSRVINNTLRLAFGILLVSNSYGQGCAPVNAKRPLMFVTYERMVEDKLVLALHNNTTCAIYVTSIDTPSSHRVIKFPDGKTKLEKRTDPTFYDLSNGELVGDLVFEFRESRFSDRRTSTTAEGDVFSTRRIPSGVTIYFQARRSSFTEAVNLVVPFSYEWEENVVPTLRGNAVHYVYFSFPESLTKRARK